jgi:phosphohistidine phosphatase SixA
MRSSFESADYARSTMLVFLVRHAHSDRGDPDELRPLSTRGREEARTLARRLAAHTTPPQLVLSSPLFRARETAEAIAEASSAELRVDDRLAPGATTQDLREAVRATAGPVAAVCHQPDCSEIALELTGNDPGFPPGGVAEITVDA